jgi:hypothetical protein
MPAFESMKPPIKPRTQLQQDAAREVRVSSRYPVVLAVRYTTAGRFAPEKTGTGRTIDMSSSVLRFAADGPLTPGQVIEVLVDWPALLDGDIRLQLALSGVIFRTVGTEVALRIQHYDFRTRSRGHRSA